MLHELVEGLAASGNRFVLTSRYVARTLRLLRGRSARFEVIHMPPLTAEDTLDMLGLAAAPGDTHEAAHLARTVQALADGRPAYVRALADELADMREHGGGDPISALASLLAPGGRLAKQCGFCYELRLHRARGYGALKAILEIPRGRGRAHAHRDFAAAAAHAGLDQGLPVVARGRGSRHVAAEALQLHRSAAARLGAAALPRVCADRGRRGARSAPLRAAALPQHEPVLAMATAGGGPSDEDKKAWGIIEID